MRQPDLFAQTESPAGAKPTLAAQAVGRGRRAQTFPVGTANAYRSLHGLLWIERHLNEPARARVPLILLV